jgi:hypothetical protein
VAVDRSEGFGERLLGKLLDRAHEMPPELIAPLVAEEPARIGGRDVSTLLQDYGQRGSGRRRAEGSSSGSLNRLMTPQRLWVLGETVRGPGAR